jgi:hypothetical protein
MRPLFEADALIIGKIFGTRVLENNGRSVRYWTRRSSQLYEDGNCSSRRACSPQELMLTQSANAQPHNYIMLHTRSKRGEGLWLQVRITRQTIMVLK